MKDQDTSDGPPSSLDLDRVVRQPPDRRATRAEAADLPLAGGDLDADAGSAATVGDETPGGDNSTPDQDIVDEIGRAAGIEYQDNEPLRGAEKVQERDRKRWELDPASSEDYRER